MVTAVKIAQELVTIPEEPVTNVKSLLESDEEPVSNVETLLESEEEPVTIATPKRKPGRPAGAKSKVPGKPRAKRVAKAPLTSSDEEPPPVKPRARTRPPPEESSDDEEPQRQTRKLPTSAYDRDSALMLSMLNQQHRARANRKADLWRSWFTR